MRIIKFRGKCTPDSRFAGEWVDGGCVQCTESDDVLIISASSDNCTMTCHVIPETVGQFTGIFDKNGTEICEGDIMLFHGRKYFAVWDEEEVRFVFTNKTNNRLTPYKSTSEECFEIIGNIHDNPELLKT